MSKMDTTPLAAACFGENRLRPRPGTTRHKLDLLVVLFAICVVPTCIYLELVLVLYKLAIYDISSNPSSLQVLAGGKKYLGRGSNPRPYACGAYVITSDHRS